MSPWNNSITRDLFDQVMVPTYNPPQAIPVRGEGSRVWDQQGREYIDFAGGIAVTCLGHAHPRLLSALQKQAAKVWHLSNVMTNEPALRLARRLCELTFAERVFFTNSGAEANEAALKLSRKHASARFGAHKHEIIAFEQAFHGRTLFTVSVGGQPKYTEGFEPLPAGIRHVPYNDLAAVEAVISERTCAVIVEPILGEAGIVPGDPTFLAGLRTLCDRNSALLIFDEIQTGVGRTGELYAYMGLGVTPDILTTAKGLGGGIPIGAMLTTAPIAASFAVGSHGSTYGGNPLACAVANEAVAIVSEPALLAGVRARHQELTDALRLLAARYGVFDQIRGRGLLIGCALTERWQGRAREFLRMGLDEGVMLLVAGADTLRLAPSLVIPQADLDEGLRRLERVLARALASEPSRGDGDG
ncbi:MAG: aspartate aminotransferase family protein [Nitrococcus sp.]|nr:aspartate aminotransferase family protein [Nitrococcus sp.]